MGCAAVGAWDQDSYATTELRGADRGAHVRVTSAISIHIATANPRGAMTIAALGKLRVVKRESARASAPCTTSCSSPAKSILRASKAQRFAPTWRSDSQWSRASPMWA